MEIPAVYALSTAGSAVHLVFARAKLECREVADAAAYLRPSVAIVVAVAPALGVDGVQRWRVIETSFAGTVVRESSGEAATIGVADARLGGHTQATFALTRERRGQEDATHRLTLDARVDAIGCGPVAGHAPIADRPQPDVELTVAGARIPIHGATLRTRGTEQTIRLSSAPIDCDDDPGAGDVTLSLRLASPSSVDRAGLDGTAFSDGVLAVYGPPPPPISVHLAPTSGAAPVRADLDGDLVVQGFRLHLAGFVSLLPCKALPFPLPISGP